MLREFDGYLEILGHPNGKDYMRWERTIQKLRGSKINNQNIAFVFGKHEEPTTVPHFDHSVYCGEHCSKDPEPWGVKRYFSISLILDSTEEAVETFATYAIDSNSHIIICGVVKSYPTIENGELKKLSQFSTKAI